MSTPGVLFALGLLALQGCVPLDNPYDPEACNPRCGEGRFCLQGRCVSSSGRWVPLPAGVFRMGSPADEPCRGAGETPHLVTLTHRLSFSATEVTQGQFFALMGYNPSFHTGCGPDCPADGVTWDAAAAYCNALSRAASLQACYACTGQGASVSCAEGQGFSGSAQYLCPGYRLPTEAEWEYAYRAGTVTALYSGGVSPKTCAGCEAADPGAGRAAWHCAGSGGATHPVGQKEPNLWGLYDMAGNVYEWVNDRAGPAHAAGPAVDPNLQLGQGARVARGGDLAQAPGSLRAAHRALVTSYGRYRIGFRCVRTLGQAGLLDDQGPGDQGPERGVPELGVEDTGTPDQGTPDLGTTDQGTPDQGPGAG